MVALLVLPGTLPLLLLMLYSRRRARLVGDSGEGNGMGAVDANCGVPHRVMTALYALVAMIVIVCCLVSIEQAQAAVKIPEHSQLYRLQLERAAGAEWGLNAPVARLAAQIHQESRWKPNAASKYAVGLSQFTPATAKWLPTICPKLGTFDPWDATQSMTAMVCYDAWLLKRTSGATECDLWAFALSDYNGGMKWRALEQKRATDAGLDRLRWFGHTATQRARSETAWKENRAYVHRILRVIERVYAKAGWPSTDGCEVT